MKILYIVSVCCFIVIAFAAFAVARHIRKASAVAAELERKKPVASARAVAPRVASKSGQRKLRRAS